MKRHYVTFRWRNWTITTALPATDTRQATGLAMALLKQDIPGINPSEVAIVDVFEAETLSALGEHLVEKAKGGNHA